MYSSEKVEKVESAGLYLEEEDSDDLPFDIDENFLSLETPRVKTSRPVKKRNPKMGIFTEENYE